MSDYTPTIGIECHVQFKTVTKLFSGAGNDARQAPPNTLISHIDLGMPGALPVLNAKALEYGIRAAFALGTEPQTHSEFDRKQYFYPDLPMGYQITQFYHPIIRGGQVEFEFNGQKHTVRIHEAHLEADAGKSTHPTGTDYSLVDLNRAGTPLLEIVSEPDMHSPAEARAYARELYLLMKYAGVSDANLYYGNMRFDVNVSLSKDSTLGTRSETKNLNSFRAVEKAAEYEIKRQTELLNKGQAIVQETRGWDEAKQKTVSQRSKEEAHDYRYMPEPDIPPIVLTDVQIKPVRGDLPVMPAEWRTKLKAAGLSPATIETLLEYPSLIDRLAEVQKLDSSQSTIKRVGDWFVNVILSEELKRNPNIDLEGSLNSTPSVLLPAGLVDLSKMTENDQLSSSAAKSLLITYWSDLGGVPERAKDMGLIQVSDEGAIAEIVTNVLKANPQAVADAKQDPKAIGFLVGQVMKESKGQANPQLAQELIKKQLG